MVLILSGGLTSAAKGEDIMKIAHAVMTAGLAAIAGLMVTQAGATERSNALPGLNPRLKHWLQRNTTSHGTITSRSPATSHKTNPLYNR